MYEIIEMCTEHIKDVVKIYDDAFRTNTDISPNVEDKFKRLSNDDSYKFLIAVDIKNKAVGFLMCHFISDFFEDDKDFMSMWSLCVAKEIRNSGVATALLEKAEDIAIKHDCCFITFITGKNRNNAHRIYRKLGFDLDSEFGVIKNLNT